MTNTTSHESLMDLIDAYAEARHRKGLSTYNVETQAARKAVTDYIEAIGAGGMQPLSLQKATPAGVDQAQEAINSGASGGVSGPLMGRASLSANAGEPVAWRYVPSKVWGDKIFTDDPVCAEDARAAGCVVESLYLAAPPTAQAGGWISVDERLPEPGTPVLLDIGEKYPIRAMWAAKHTVQAADDDTDWGEYVEADDMYYAPEGWYEWNQCEDNHWRVTETPRAWMPLPPTSAEGVEHG